MQNSLSCAKLQPSYGCLQTRSAFDVDEHASNLSAWDQHYDQISAGRFCGGVSELWTPQAQVFYEHASSAVRQQCCVWPDAWWFGIPVRHDGTRMGGKEAPEGAVLVRHGNTPFELVTPAGHQIFGIVVQQSALEQFCTGQGYAVDWARLQRANWVQAESGRYQQTVDQLQGLFAALACNPVAGGHEQACHGLEFSLLEMLLPFLQATDGESVECSASQRRRQVVLQVMELARQQPDWVPSVPELCAQFHLSRRALQYAFEEVLGCSPASYLRAIRLNGARRSLRTQQYASVQDTAAAWGFWNLSQFSADYRRFFGERPSQTLQCAMTDGLLSAAGAHHVH